MNLFLEKFIDKYNDFIQYFNTHMISFWQFWAVYLFVFLSVSLSESTSGYIWDELQHTSVKIFITLLVAQWVGMTVNHLEMCVFLFFLSCSIFTTMALVWNMASIPSESVKRSLPRLRSYSLIFVSFHNPSF